MNTPPRLKSCRFWANPPIGELGAQGAIPPPLEDDDRGVVVPIEGHAATALNPAVRAIPESMSKIQTPHEAVRHTLPKTVYFFYGQETTILI